MYGICNAASVTWPRNGGLSLCFAVRFNPNIQDLVEDLSNIIIVYCVLGAISRAAFDHLSEILLQVFIVYQLIKILFCSH